MVLCRSRGRIRLVQFRTHLVDSLVYTIPSRQNWCFLYMVDVCCIDLADCAMLGNLIARMKGKGKVYTVFKFFYNNNINH